MMFRHRMRDVLDRLTMKGTGCKDPTAPSKLQNARSASDLRLAAISKTTRCSPGQALPLWLLTKLVELR
jgi:hypothetical protein